jgi:GT2 family glycosyltransferase
MNVGIRYAKGDIIIRVDGHTIIAPDYISICVETLRRTNSENAGGRMDAKGSTKFGRVVEAATSTPFGVGGSRFHYSEIEEEVDTVYMGAWPKDVFEKIGLFDEEMVRDQDDELNYRLREKGGKIILNPMIKSSYTNRGNPFSLWTQYFQYGLYKIRVLQKHPTQMSVRHFIPPLFVLSLLLSVILSIATPWGWMLLALATGSYFIADSIASLITVLKKGWEWHYLYLPFAFGIMHISYGLGFLIGIVKFWNRWGDRAGKTPVLPQELFSTSSSSAAYSYKR